MLLSEHLKAKKLTYAAFGRLSGLPRVTVRQYALGLRRPRSPDVMRRIAEASEGCVTANDFYAAEAA